MRKSLLLVLFLFAAASVLFSGCGSFEKDPSSEESKKTGFELLDGKETEMGKVFDKLGLEYGLVDGKLKPEKITELFLEELEKGKLEGYTPVIVAPGVLGDSIIETMLEEYDPSELLKAELPDGKAWLDSVIEEYQNPSDPGLDRFDFDEMRDDSAKGEELTHFTSLDIVSEGGDSDIFLVKVPTDKPWEAVLYIPFGGWNACPEPIKMAAVCKYWYEKYGAQPAVITGDQMEFCLPSPVSGYEVREAALEHFAFCEDRVFQCTWSGTFSELEDSIGKSAIWYFWWD